MNSHDDPRQVHRYRVLMVSSVLAVGALSLAVLVRISYFLVWGR
jgi:hypothetical protein